MAKSLSLMPLMVGHHRNCVLCMCDDGKRLDVGFWFLSVLCEREQSLRVKGKIEQKCFIIINFN